MGSPSHWISRESGSTPLGRLTLHVSVYEVPVTPDPSPDTTTSGDSATTVIDMARKCNTELYEMFNILKEIGLPVVLGKCMYIFDLMRATIRIFVMGSRGRSIIIYDL